MHTATVIRKRDLTAQNTCLISTTILTVLSIIIVALRLYTRRFILHNLGNDDYAIVVALLLVITYLVILYVMRDYGMGFHTLQLSLEQTVNFIKATLAIQVIYYLIINTIKASILLSYLRIAVTRKLKLLCKCTIAFLGTFLVVCLICTVTQCIPLHKMWDLTGQVAGKCINTTALFYSTSSIHIVIDVWIIALPISTILKIRRSRRERAALVVAFCLGGFSCIASIIRLHAIRIYTESSDPIYDGVPINIWSMVEVNVGILSASIPAVRILLLKAVRPAGQHRLEDRQGKNHRDRKDEDRKPGHSDSDPYSVYGPFSMSLMDRTQTQPSPPPSVHHGFGAGAYLDSGSESERPMRPAAAVLKD